ncbi:hypothetical protein [Pelagibaculum spongiae]|uniref:Uncharacterized protein n=1 Tax=Pelagibaculum spongiae TaxID=2080658 RepID=A0A2V1GS23_9GAMM|nr:hypothetical protein [Pelagibaculum spongiae]PVZ64526.1 hypothetical protein DC094_19640 [Pelagibaculum spongiae]
MRIFALVILITACSSESQSKIEIILKGGAFCEVVQGIGIMSSHQSTPLYNVEVSLNGGGFYIGQQPFREKINKNKLIAKTVTNGIAIDVDIDLKKMNKNGSFDMNVTQFNQTNIFECSSF